MGLVDAELAELQLLLEREQQLDALSSEERQRFEYRAKLEASPAEFFKAAWNILEPGRPLCWSWHYELIGEYLLKVWRREITRLIINVPPRTAKSTEGTICWPAWGWARDARSRFLTASYSKDLSSEHSSKRRNLIDSEWYQSLWPITFSEDTNRKDQYRNSVQGEMIATSVGATGTGRGGDILILDDGLSADQALSESERKTAHEWFRDTFRTRLNDPSTGAIVVIEQRTGYEDVTGWLLHNEPGQWTQVVIPLVQDAKEEVVIDFPVSGRQMIRPVDDVLQPTRHTPEVVTSRKVHRRTHETQDQQRPAPDGGNICKREWWKYYRAVPATFDMVVDSWDFAFKDVKQSDFVAGFKFGIVGANRYILDALHGQMNFPASRDALKRLALREPRASRILVEDKANGPAIIQSLQDTVPGIIAVEPQGSKYARAYAASGDIEAGNVYLPDLDAFPQHRWWVDLLIEEWAMFPSGPNDDTVDASGQAINETRAGVDKLMQLYQRLNAEDAAKAAEKAAPPKPAAVNGNGKHEWSESIRTVGMGIVPRGIIDPAELEQWIQFCEASAQTERASFARQLLAQRTAEEA
jgi:predicted phage terminase large subunit-like protein